MSDCCVLWVFPLDHVIENERAGLVCCVSGQKLVILISGVVYHGLFIFPLDVTSRLCSMFMSHPGPLLYYF